MGGSGLGALYKFTPMLPSEEGTKRDGGGDGWKRMVPKGWFVYPMFENREKYLLAIEIRG